MNNYYDDRKESKQCRWILTDLLQKWFVLKPTPNQTISNIQKVLNQKHSHNKSGFWKKTDETGALGALQGNRCKTLQTSGFDVNDVLQDHLPFLRSFHAMYI